MNRWIYKRRYPARRGFSKYRLRTVESQGNFPALKALTFFIFWSWTRIISDVFATLIQVMSPKLCCLREIFSEFFQSKNDSAMCQGVFCNPDINRSYHNTADLPPLWLIDSQPMSCFFSVKPTTKNANLVVFFDHQLQFVAGLQF